MEMHNCSQSTHVRFDESYWKLNVNDFRSLDVFRRHLASIHDKFTMRDVYKTLRIWKIIANKRGNEHTPTQVQTHNASKSQSVWLCVRAFQLKFEIFFLVLLFYRFCLMCQLHIHIDIQLPICYSLLERKSGWSTRDWIYMQVYTVAAVASGSTSSEPWTVSEHMHVDLMYVMAVIGERMRSKTDNTRDKMQFAKVLHFNKIYEHYYFQKEHHRV